ncbi:MAG: serine hydrolase domain-containing protein [Pseudomonadota bacterium]
MPTDDPFDVVAAHLAGLCRAGRFLSAGLARIDGAGEAVRVFGRTAPGGPVLTDPTLRLRMASISKAATARAVMATTRAMGVPLSTPVGEALDIALPGVTLDHLLGHLSGLTDHGGYVVDPPASVPDFVASTPGAISDARPGTFFRYANLNYVILGLVLDVLAGERFDRVLRREVLDPAGIGGGFNWAGVADRRALPVFQRHGDALTCEADGAVDPKADLIWRDGRAISLDGYRLGHDTMWFSPHAGLRMNVIEAARLARLLGADDDVARAQRQVRWRFDGSNGEDCGGLFTAFGAGVTIYDGHPRLPGRLTGHAGHALGFTGGAWFDHDTEAAWGYFLNGSPDMTDGQDEEAFYDPDEAFVMARL